jgi:hypothetical protein
MALAMALALALAMAMAMAMALAMALAMAMALALGNRIEKGERMTPREKEIYLKGFREGLKKRINTLKQNKKREYDPILIPLWYLKALEKEGKWDK